MLPIRAILLVVCVGSYVGAASPRVGSVAFHALEERLSSVEQLEQASAVQQREKLKAAQVLRDSLLQNVLKETDHAELYSRILFLIGVIRLQQDSTHWTKAQTNFAEALKLVDILLRDAAVRRDSSRLVSLQKRHIRYALMHARVLRQLDKHTDAVAVLSTEMKRLGDRPVQGLEQSRIDLYLQLASLTFEVGQFDRVVDLTLGGLLLVSNQQDSSHPVVWYRLLADALSIAEIWQGARFVLSQCLVKCHFKERRDMIAIFARIHIVTEAVPRKSRTPILKQAQRMFGVSDVEEELSNFHKTFKSGASLLHSKRYAHLWEARHQWSRLRSLQHDLPQLHPWDKLLRQAYSHAWSSFTDSAVYRKVDPKLPDIWHSINTHVDSVLNTSEAFSKWQAQDRGVRTVGSDDDGLPSEEHLVAPFHCCLLAETPAPYCRVSSMILSYHTHKRIARQLQQLAVPNSVGPPFELNRADYPALTASVELRVTVYSSDMQRIGHPMVHIVRAFVRYANPQTTHLTLALVHPSPELKGLLSSEVLLVGGKVLDLTDLTELQAARAILDSRPHILLDMTGRTGSYARPGIVSLKPAPVAVAWGGFPGTSGDPAVDYIMGDQHTTPLIFAGHYSERIIQLPGTWLLNDHLRVFDPAAIFAARALDERNRRRVSLGLPRVGEGVVFANFNRPFKIDRLTFMSWCTVVRRVPGSVLVLMAMSDTQAPIHYGSKRNLEQFWSHPQHCGLPTSRLVWLPKQSSVNGSHIQTWTVVDVVLDTLLYNGGMTTVDGLYAGVPHLTVSGSGSGSGSGKFTELMGSALVHAAGLADCVLPDLLSFVEAAVSLGNEPARLRELTERTAQAGYASNGTPSVLFDPERGAHDVVVALRAAYELWQSHPQGLPRDAHIVVDGAA